MAPRPVSPRGRWLLGGSLLGSLMVITIAGSAASLPASALHAIRPLRDRSDTAEVITRIADRACPREMTRVDGSCVDRFEGTLVEIHDDGTETPWSAHEPPNGHRVRAVSRPGVVPQGHISMVEAQRACKASNKRLCRADEWKAACKGPEKTRYPYGDTRVAHACVDTDRTSPMNVLFSGEHSGRTMNDPRANQQPNTLAPTAQASQCTNGYGVHDMVGNVHEWTDDGSFRGGYYLDTKLNGEGCSYRTTAHAPAYYDYSTGFRCCADVGTVTID